MRRTALARYAHMTIRLGGVHRHRFAAPQRDGGVIEPHRDWITPKQALVQNLDRGVLHKAQFEQAALKLDCTPMRRGPHLDSCDPATETASGQAQRKAASRALCWKIVVHLFLLANVNNSVKRKTI